MLIDQSEVLCDIISKEFKNLDLKIDTAQSLDKAYNIILSSNYDLIISNLNFTSNECSKMLKVFYYELPAVPVILMTKSDKVNIRLEQLQKEEKDEKNSKLSSLIKECFDIDQLVIQVKQLLFADTEIRKKYNYIIPLHNGFEKKLILNSAEKITNYAPTFLIKDLVALGYMTIEDTFPIKTALIEIISNALYHGNFDIDSKVRNSGSFEGQKIFKARVSEKEKDEIFYNKKIILTLKLNTDLVLSISVEDEGKGFDWKSKLSTDVKGLMFSGKGLFLAKAMVDDMKFNEKGNIVTIFKQLKK